MMGHSSSPKRKMACLIIYILLALVNGQNSPDFPKSSQEYDFSGDISRFFLDPLPNPDEISGNVVGPKDKPGVSFTSIQDALDQSNPNATIYVLSGEYHENLNLSKPGIILRGVDTGEGAPKVSAVGHSSTITIAASACTVDGFVVMNSGNPEAGIAVLSDNNRISNNTLTNNSGYGLRLSRNSGNTIYGNRIDKNGFDGIYLEGSSSNFIISNSVEDNKINGIYLKDSDKNILKGNLFTNNGKDGILLENSHNNIIIGNSYDSLREVNSQDNIIQENKILTQEDIQIIEPKQEPPSEEILFLQVAPGGSIQQALDSISPGGSIEITGGTYDGTIVIDKANIALLGLGNPEIRGNGVDSTITLLGPGSTLSGLVVTNSGNPHAGVDIRAPSCKIQGCQIRNNRGYGISVASSQGSNITDNAIANNGLGGIAMQDSRNCRIYRNSVVSNGGFGIDLSSSTNNVIFLNNFNNAFNARDSGSGNRWNCDQEISYVYYSRTISLPLGNYWSDYSDADDDGDGVGDTPYSLGVGSARDMYPLIKPWPFQEPPLLISGNKFDDRNGNGEKDPDEAGLSGWKIMLAGPGGFNRTEYTDGSGLYTFAGLAPGRYTVSEEIKLGYVQTYPGESVVHNVTLLESSVDGRNFGNCRNDLYISGSKFEDYMLMASGMKASRDLRAGKLYCLEQKTGLSPPIAMDPIISQACDRGAMMLTRTLKPIICRPIPPVGSLTEQISLSPRTPLKI